MDAVRLSKPQMAAFAVVQQIEPLMRGFVLIGAEPTPVTALVAIDLDGEINPELRAGMFSVGFNGPVMLVEFHSSSLTNAEADARVVRERLEGLEILGAVLISGDYVLDRSTGKVSSLEHVIATLPEGLGQTTPLNAWALSRARQHALVAPAIEPEQLEELEDRWIHTIVTGQIPDERLVANIAAAVLQNGDIDSLLVATGRLAYDQLDESAGSEEVMNAFFGRNGQPKFDRLVVAAITAQYAASHIDDGQAAAALYALSGILLWSAARASSALRAIEVAMLHDQSNSMAHTMAKLMRVLEYPEWMTRP